MVIEAVNAEFVTQKIKENGWTRKYVIEQLGLGQDGYKFLRGEWMPKNVARKTTLVRSLAKMCRAEVPQILVRFEAKAG